LYDQRKETKERKSAILADTPLTKRVVVMHVNHKSCYDEADINVELEEVDRQIDDLQQMERNHPSKSSVAAL